jgi:hypothetical protein
MPSIDFGISVNSIQNLIPSGISWFTKIYIDLPYSFFVFWKPNQTSPTVSYIDLLLEFNINILNSDDCWYIHYKWEGVDII